MINKFLLLGLFLIACIDVSGQCATNTTNGGTIGGSNTYCIDTDPAGFTNIALPTGGSGSLNYQWEISTDNVNWNTISGATISTYNYVGALTATTYFRRRSKRATCTVWGATSNPITVTILKSDAGLDQGKCANASFTMNGNAAPTAPAGYTGTWSVVSGSATITTPSSRTSAVNVPTGTATLRWTLSNGTCTKIDDVVLSNQTNTLALSTPVVSACINQPLQDVVTVDVNLSWSTTLVGQKINVTLNNKTEVVDPATVTSPHTLRFLLPANNTSGHTISAQWTGVGCTAVTSSAFAVPAACSSDQINCNILYLCGLDKPFDGDPFDHGLMEYITSVNGGTMTGALTKTDASGYGLYDLNNTSSLLSLNLDNYGLIIVSPTTEGHIAAGLVEALKGWKGSVLNMNYAIMQGLGYSSNNYVSWSNDAYINAVETLLNYDNPTSYMGKLLTLGDYYSTAVPYVWKDSGSKTANLGGVYFKYAPHTNTQISSTHGTRAYLGYHMNGIYGNPTNGGVIPAPATSYFTPTKHLTQKGKEVLDNALIASATCATENCTNNIDDDGDGLVDCLDPDCNLITNGEFDNGTTGWWSYASNGAAGTMSIDNTKQVSGSNSAKINIATSTGTDWHVQLGQNSHSFVSGKTYKISFKAKASSARNIALGLQLTDAPYTNYFYGTAALTTVPQTYSFEYTATTTLTNQLTFVFHVGTAIGDVWIDQVEFKEACGVPTLSCPSECPSPNQLINSSFPLDVSGWTTNGTTELGGGGTYGNYIVLNNANTAGPFTVYQEYAVGANKEYLFNGYAAKHATTNNAKVYLEFYNGTTYISKTADFNVTKNYDGTFQAITPVLGYTPAGTTKIRVVGWCAGTAIKLDELSLKVCVPKPTITSSTPDTICAAGVATLNATASAGVVNWYAAPTGGTTLFTGTSFTTPSISTTTTYYAEAVSNSCYSASRTAVIAKVGGCGEICSNGIDDDGDGQIDALDTDCNSCTSIGQNLIINGEFDAGATGFTSDYAYRQIDSMCGNHGIYGISNRISKVGAPLGCNNSIWSAADRAGLGGNFMIIDPSLYTGLNDRIWAQTITVCPNTDYVFSVWTKNIYYSEAPSYSGIDPNFQFKINNVTLPGADFTMPRKPKADSLIWVKVQGTWNSGSATSAILNIVNKVPGSSGNDLAIDGLFFGLCGKEVAISTNNNNFCQGSGTATLSASAPTIVSDWKFFEWVRNGVVVASGANLSSYAATTAGTYKLRVYTTTNNTGCPQESNAIVITTNICGEICTNGIDDDGDGQVDCLDADCAGIVLSVPTIGACTSYPIQDSASVSVNVSWTSAPVGGKIKLTIGSIIKFIDVASGLSSPQTVVFNIPANGLSSNLTAEWSGSSLTQNPLANINNFQLMTNGNITFNGSTHVHGTLGVGGNLILNGSPEINMDNVGTYTFPGDPNTTGLLVKGGITWQSGAASVLSGKYIHINTSTGSTSSDNGVNNPTQIFPNGGSYNNAIRIGGSIDQTPSPAVFQTVGFDFDNEFAKMRSNSEHLGTFANNVTLMNASAVAISGNNVTSPTNVVISTLSSTQINYLDLTSTSLNNITELKFEGAGIPSSSKILVITVPISANFVWNNVNMPALSGVSNGPYILWNFTGTTSYNLTINNSSLIIGSIFAPNHNLIKLGTGDIDGQIVVKSGVFSLGENHYNLFAGVLPSLTGSCTAERTLIAPNPCTEICTNGIDDDGDGQVDCLDADCAAAPANAGNDITQCMNAAFLVIGNNPPAGQTGQWTLRSGSAILSIPTNNDSLTVTLGAGLSSTLRWTITKGSCTSIDSVVINNTTSCTPTCIDAINPNGDLENEGTATNFNLTFQGTPALLMTTGINPAGWVDAYGSTAPNTATFQGAYYIKKTGAQGNPHSGTHMIYSDGGYCFSPYSTEINVSCGKTYKISAWAAAYTNGPLQLSTPFLIEFFASGSSMPTPFTKSISLNAPASTSWNNLNWQHYEMIVTLPVGMVAEEANFLFTTSFATRGLVVDDVCITELSTGSDAKAGQDQFGCSNTFTLAANTPPAGYTGTWSVVGGVATISNVNLPNATATITSGSTASLLWTVTNGAGCTKSDNLVLSYSNVSVSVDNDTVCAGSMATLTATGCVGDLLWSTGATTTSINISPASTTSYQVTCTPTPSPNVSLNNGFEAATNMQDWVSWGGTNGITTVPSEVRTGAKAAKIDATTQWGGIGQTITGFPSFKYTISFYAKATNTNAEPKFQYRYLNSAYTGLVNWTYVPITSTSYQLYTITAVSPLNTAFFEYAFNTGEVSILYIDDISITKINGCTTSATGTVTTKALPGTKIIESGERCGPGSVELKILLSSSNSNWYSAATGGTLLGTGNTYNTPSISTTTTYYIEGEQNGCISATRLPITATINPFPTISLSGPAAICIDGNTTLTASVPGGVWTSSDTTIAKVNASGVITGKGEGTAIITYVSPAGCNATNTIAIDVDNNEQKTINGDNTLCMGETADFELNNSSGIGTWGVVNSSIVTINQNGEVTTVAPGTTLITYTQASNVCGDTAFYAITVNPIPVITISGPTTICIGDQTTSFASNIAGGSWQSSNNAVATISAAGVITGVSSGTATFTFIVNGTLCASLPSTTITVRPAAIITLNGSPNLCINANAVLSSNIAGTWSSNNPTIASIGLNNGVITALSSGTATFTFTSTVGSCVTAAPQQINVASPMTVSITSPSACYINNMVLDAQITGGNRPFAYTWSGPAVNSTDSIATINTAGTYNLIVQSAYGCQVSTNKTILPTFIGGIIAPDTVCQNTVVAIQTNISGATYQWGGTAQNSKDSIVMVIPAFPSTLYSVTVENSSGCVINLNKTIQVYQKPTISFTGADPNLCPGGTTTFNANTTGYWFSSNPNVATITNSGIVTAIDSGTVRFIFQNSSTNCFSDSSIIITVRKEPTITTDANGSLCVGTSAQINSSVAGTWINNNPTIASITGTGLVTGLAVGMASFDFVAASGCQSNANFQIPVNLKPIITLTGDSVICIGATTQFFPPDGGTWQSGNPSIATITNAGLVTGVGAGTTRFIFTNSGGCVSDSSKLILVNGKPTIGVDGPNSICVGDKTQMTSYNVVGQWEGLNNDVAIISSVGEVTGISSGVASFIFKNSLTNCYSNASENITVLGRPNVNVLGPNILCIGSTSLLSPNNSGTWVSSDTMIAKVTNGGIVTAVGQGSATFIFTNSITGCVSNATLPIQVQDKAPVSILGSSTICIGSTTQLLPDFGGIWESNDTSIAIVSNTGLVTGKKIGSTTFRFTPSNGCTSNNTAPVTVGTAPNIFINGPSVLCVGDTSQMNPGFGGQWTSTNTLAATINNNGQVVAKAQGQARFIFTTSTGCVSNPSLPIIINSPPPPPFLPKASLCIGDSLQLSPAIEATWISSNPTVATVDNFGKVRALSSGQVRFRFTDQQTGCVSGLSGIVTVNESPTITGDRNTLCLGSTMTLAPFTPGVWLSSDATVLGISLNGNQVNILGKKSGIANVSFFSSVTGCASSNVYPVTVNDPANVIFNRLRICIGDTTQLNVSNMLGSWSSLTPNIATITPTGLVTTKAKGVASFSFLQNNSICTHVPSQNLVVLERPYVAADGLKDICVNSTTQLLPSSGGTWSSSNTSIATINNNGLVSGVGAGTAYFTYSEIGSGCVSDTTLHVNVGVLAPPVYTGPDIVCIGYSGSLIAGVSQTVWSSSDAAIANISQDGIFSGRAPGKVKFRFTDAANNCQSDFSPNFITIKNCVDPDFNVTGINRTIYGSLATNDDIPGISNARGQSAGDRTATVRYLQPILDFKPINSAANLFVDEAGSYTFNTNTPGKYRYKVPVCINDEQFGCPTMLVEFTAVDTKSPAEKYISNLDIGTIYGGDTEVFNTLSNDKVLYGNGTLPSINWENGSGMSNIVSGSTNMSYSASNTAGKYGMDTMNYSMCWPNPNIANCYASTQYMVVNAPSALNSIVGADDFTITSSATPVTINVLTNDMDPENDSITITPQGSVTSMINIPSGKYCVEPNGVITYIPSNGFFGSVDIIYNICDNNINQECTKATAHILVLEDVKIKLKAYLEGALLSNNSALSSTGKPLMRDELRYSTLNGKRAMPVQSPYKVNPFNIDIINLPSLYVKVNDDASRNSAIVDSNAVFGVTGENAIVDWVYVQIRSKSDNKIIIGTRSGLIQRDGDIVDLDGVSDLSFANIVADSFYVMVKHRNHLGVMSGLVPNGTKVDFTNPNTPVFNFGTQLNNGMNYTGLSMNSEVIPGYTALWAGDLNSDGLVKYTAPDDDRNIILSDVLLDKNNSSFTTNYDFTIGYFQGDFNLNAKTKHDNPDDDTNYLFGQIILYPLNNSYLANYGLLIEQVPK